MDYVLLFVEVLEGYVLSKAFDEVAVVPRASEGGIASMFAYHVGVGVGIDQRLE